MNKLFFLMCLVASTVAILLAFLTWFDEFRDFTFLHMVLGMLGASGLTLVAVLSSEFVHVNDLFKNSEEVKE